MPGLRAADMDAVQEAVDALKNTGLDVQALGEVEPNERGITFDVRVSATNYDRFGQSSVAQGESDSGDETEGHNDTADDDHGGGSDMAAESSPQTDAAVEEFGEHVEAGTDVDDDPDADADGTGEDQDAEEIGIYTAKDYGLVLSSAQKYVDSDRVSVVGRPFGAVLVSGTEPDSAPDYAVGDSQIQLATPGCEAIGAKPGDEVRAVATAEGVRLELVDDRSDDDGIDDQSSERVWCGACGTGPFIDAEAVEDHHDHQGHPGDPVPKSTDPNEASTGADEETTADGGVAVQGPPSTDTAAGVTCQNCGAQVSQRYARVWAPENQEDVGPRTCPNCDKVRERDGTVRDPRSTGGERDV